MLKGFIGFFGSETLAALECMPSVRVSAAGWSNGVNYILVHENKSYSFHGYPDFVALRDNYGAQRILAVGEVQNTSYPDTQNSIANTSAIMCIMIFKRKCHLSYCQAEEGPTGNVIR